MSTETEAVQEITKVRGMMIIEQAFGNITLCNTELITKKVVDLMVACLDDGGFEADGHGLFSIIFRDDGYPISEEGDQASWMFYPNSLSAVCNLEGCINIAITNTQNIETPNSEFVSVYALVWKNIIEGFFHEAHHSNAFLQDGHNLWDNKEARLKEEEKADEYARMMLFKLAKTTDVEIEFSEEISTMITKRLMEEIATVKELLPNLEKDRKEDNKLARWYTSQKHMMSHGGVYYDEDEDSSDPAISLKTFKEFLHVCSGDAEDDAEWLGDTIGQQLELKQEPVNEDANGNTVPSSVDVSTVINNDAVESYDDMPFEPDEVPASAGFQGVSQFQQAVPAAQQPAPVMPAPANTSPPVAPVAPTATPANPVAPTATPVAPTNNPAVVVGANAYPEIQLTAGVDAKTVVYGLYLKIFKHLFQDCQYNPTDNSVPFAGVGNIVNWVQLDQNESLFVKEMTCYSPDGKGTWCPGTKVNGAISGIIIDKAKTLPAYELVLSTPEGTQIKRKFIPQNPNKMVNGQLTTTAADAKAGNQIMWIIDPDTKAYSVRVYNGVVQQNINGRWA